MLQEHEKWGWWVLLVWRCLYCSFVFAWPNLWHCINTIGITDIKWINESPFVLSYFGNSFETLYAWIRRRYALPGSWKPHTHLILFFFDKKTRVHRYDKTKYSYLLHNGLCIYSISGVLLIFLPAICQLRTGLLIIYSSLIPILYRPIVSFFQPQLFFL